MNYKIGQRLYLNDKIYEILEIKDGIATLLIVGSFDYEYLNWDIDQLHAFYTDREDALRKVIKEATNKVTDLTNELSSTVKQLNRCVSLLYPVVSS